MTAKKAAPKNKAEVEFDLADPSSTPADGDRCSVKVFDTERAKAVAGPICIYDAPRGVFFKCPELGGGGSIIGPRRDNYKAERVRNVVSYLVLDAELNPNPEADSIIDHARGLERASTRPPKVATPPDTD